VWYIRFDHWTNSSLNQGQGQLLDLITEDARSSSKAEWPIFGPSHQKIKQILAAESQMLSLELPKGYSSYAAKALIYHQTHKLASVKDCSKDLVNPTVKASW
jgi:hypothetical protein